MDIEKDSNREAFEAWFESRYDAHFMQFALDLDLYVDKHTQTCWEAWQAAKAQAVPEGFVLMPKESTEKMNKAGLQEYRKVIGVGQDDIGYIYKAMIEAQEQSHE